MHICIAQTDVESTLSVLILGGLGHAPNRKFLKIKCQKSEFGGISATKITCII